MTDKKLLSPEQSRDLILELLDQSKAEEILTIDLKGKTSIADYMIIASGRSSRQVSALAGNISERLKKEDILPRIEGQNNSDWVLLDTGDVIVHLFRPEVREFYAIEKIWDTDFPSDNPFPSTNSDMPA